jgi:predicted RNase H-like nuclease (RuvC/YqgF family)
MIDTDKYEGAKKIVEDAGLIDDNEGHLDVDYRKIAQLLAEVKRLQEENKQLRKFIDNIEWGLDEINNEYKKIKEMIK